MHGLDPSHERLTMVHSVDCPFCGETVYRDTTYQVSIVEHYGCRICNSDYYDATGE